MNAKSLFTILQTENLIEFSRQNLSLDLGNI